ncbi:hypothetical protein KC901_00675 [Patescibacteria group bacterium]|nr:hypothetical protein [Patescibacteria group bacterium]
MKTFITTILKTIFVATLFMGGVAFAHAASFDPEPLGNDGFNTINTGCSNDCANDYNEVSYSNIVNNGGGEFTVYLNFRNASSGTLNGANASISFPSSGTSSTATFSAQLNGSNAGAINDTSYVTNLPNNWQIEFVSGFVRVEEHYTNSGTSCSNVYPGTWPWQFSFSNPGYTTIGNLHDWGDGWCDQGYVFARFRVIDTTPTPNLAVQTLSVGTVTENSAVFRGKVTEGANTTANAWFVYGTNSNLNCNTSPSISVGNVNVNETFTKTKSGLSSNTTYWYQACATQNGQSAHGNPVQFTTQSSTPNLAVQTLSVGTVTENSAVFNGQLTSGSNASVWFVYATNSNPNCNTSPSVSVSGTYNPFQPFSKTKTGLSSNTTYWYRACASVPGQSAQGSPVQFTTLNVNVGYYWDVGEWTQCFNGIRTRTVVCRDSSDHQVADQFCIANVEPKPPTQESCGGNDDLIIETRTATNVSENTATIRGRVIAGQTTYPYFVWKEENLSLNCSTDTPTFPEDFGILLEGGDNFEYEFGNGQLTPNRTYYYKACAQDLNGQVVSGLREEFTTDNNGGNANADVETKSPHVNDNEVTLRGEITNVDETYWVYFVLDDSTGVSCEDDFPLIVDEVDNDEDFDLDIDADSFNENERYYYRACAINNDGDIIEGNREDFELNENNNIEIETDAPRNITQTTAEMCGTLVEDGGDSVQTWIEFRNANQSFYTSTPIRQRHATSFCERVSGLTGNTSYLYRACTPEGCAPTRSFRTLGTDVPIGQPVITTDNPTNIRSNSATLNGTYVTNAPSGTCWFNYGRTSSLGRQTRTYSVSGYGNCVHNFTNLASNTQYCIQAVIQTPYGTDTGAVRCFNTPPSTGGPTPPPVVVIDDNTEIDLSTLGLGLSLVRLEIDDQEEVVSRGQSVEYVVEWENITNDLDLFDLDLKVVMPPEIEVTDISRGRFDQDSNTIYFTIDELEAGEDGFLTVDGIVGRGTIGNLVTAQAEIAYDNPVNDAQENAIDWDVDGYGVQVAGVTASVFGLANITFLGWLVILLGLFIIFLVARWLYLEREEMRAQAYAGYAPYAPLPYHYNNYPEPRAYVEPEPSYNIPQTPDTNYRDDYYEPYRPNRG